MGQEEEREKRFIPTCVGLIPSEPDGYRLCSVHPHMRGANAKCDTGTMCATVHPHMRGANITSGF